MFLGCATAAPAADEAPSARPRLEENLTQQAFLAYQGEVFRVWGGKGAREVEELALIEVRDLGSQGPHQQFLLRFRTAKTSTLSKAAYSFGHGDGGEFDLWIEPAGQEGEYKYFEARFNLIAAGSLPPPPTRKQR